MTQKANAKVSREELILRECALGYPEATEDFPWGHRAIKVKKKAFVFMGTSDSGEFGLSVKLPQTAGMAVSLPFCRPAGYGLAKSGWVDVVMNGARRPPLELVKQFIDESYRAVAPKTLVKRLDVTAKGGVGAEPIAGGKGGRGKSGARKK